MNPRTILFVDDDEDDRHLLKEHLIHYSGEVLHVVEVGNGVEAMKYLKEAKSDGMPCLIILDLNMPVMDGRKTFEKIRVDDKLKNIPLIIYTSGFNPADREFFNKHGVRYQVKPMSLEQIRSVARDFVGACNDDDN
jgi:CheY-like chemotaxis protein